MLLPFVPYVLLGIPLIVFLCQFRGQRASGLLCMWTAVLALSVTAYFLFHSGLIGDYVIELGDKKFYVSANAFDDLITKNLDQFAESVSRAYEKYFEIETFDATRESERVEFSVDEGDWFVVVLRLKHKPIEKTIQVFVSEGIMNFEPDRPTYPVDEKNCIRVRFKMHPPRARQFVQESGLHFGVSYFRDVGADKDTGTAE